MPKTHLEELTVTLVTDGYAAYLKTVATLNEKEVMITHGACWVHARPYTNPNNYVITYTCENHQLLCYLFNN